MSGSQELATLKVVGDLESEAKEESHRIFKEDTFTVLKIGAVASFIAYMSYHFEKPSKLDNH